MSCKCVYFWGVISLLSVILSTYALGDYDINNGSFEVFDYNASLDINIPSGWQCENYTAVVNYFQPAEGGRYWKIRQLYPIEGSYFLMLSTGGVPYGTAYARAQQTITVEAGNTLIGACFFGTYDWYDWNDYGEIKLIPVSDPNLSELEIVRFFVYDVGDFSSLKEWKRFAYTFEPNQAGDYNLTIEVYDIGDIRYDSFFAVDGLVLCNNASAAGDLNLDCTTDFQDFSLLASAWLCDCNNPNNYQDPNTNCQFALDLTEDAFIDSNDLAIMSQYWLEGIREPEEPEE